MICKPYLVLVRLVHFLKIDIVNRTHWSRVTPNQASLCMSSCTATMHHGPYKLLASKSLTSP